MESIFSFIFGLKTHAIFDVWTIEHVLSGISVGSTVKRTNHKELKKILQTEEHQHHSWLFALGGVLFLAYAWETVEHYLEEGLAGPAVEYWFQGVEFWANRTVSDPFMMVIGYAIAHRYPQLVWPARVLSFLWLVIHIFVFPHSTYLHTLFGIL